MLNANNEMYDFMSQYLTKGDIYAAKAMAKVSAFILKRRHELNMTQKEFANMMGVTQAMVSKWESVEYNFTIENIAHIAEKLNMTFDIEFIPESEYLVVNANNQYESITQNEESLKNGQIVDYTTAA